jgi:RecB family endonuclease NucS
MASHGSKPTAEDLVTMKLLQDYPDLANEYWTQVEVMDGSEIGYIDLVCRDPSGHFIVIEVKSSAKQIDQAVGQVCRYTYLVQKQQGWGTIEPQRWIVAPACYPSHREVCKQLGINLVVI